MIPFRWLALTTIAGLVLNDSRAECPAGEPPPPQAVNTWQKLSPLPDGPVSPRLGYEGACVWDSRHRLLVRYGGHNQGGGGEQGAEVWTFNPLTAVWTLKEPNTSPPGVCCNAQNVYDPALGRYIRFPFFSGSHGWQWQRELYLNDSSVWTYDLATNTWRNRRPVPTPRLAPYRCASWDSDRQVVVVFGGEGGRDGTVIYDPWRNEWTWPNPEREPEGRSGGNMAYDAARKRHVLFGSQFTDDPHTWTYDVATNEWRDMQPASMPPTDQNDAVLTYDPIHQVVLALVKISTKSGDEETHEVQTWAYDAGRNLWTRRNPAVEPDAAGNRTRNLVFAPELGVAILENCTSRPREQQVWTYCYADSAPRDTLPEPPRRETPPIVEDVVVSVLDARRVQLDWKPPADADVAGYHVERAAVEVWSEDQLTRLKTKTPPLDPPSVGAIRRIGEFQRLTKQAISERTFLDETVDLSVATPISGEPIFERELHPDQVDRGGRASAWGVYAYRVSAVDADGRLSGPSPVCFTIPSSPQHVFSREEGTTCQLKWEANPERSIAGYRIYRLDGRWDSDSVSRLTAEPVSQTTYADASAGSSTRRYYVVAVDALGQEGFPSAPVWFNREWREFYRPFTGEWHQ